MSITSRPVVGRFAHAYRSTRQFVTPLTLRTRLTLVATGALIASVVAMTAGARYVTLAHESGGTLSPEEFRRTVWATFACVAAVCSAAGLGVASIIASAFRQSVIGTTAEVLQLAQDAMRDEGAESAASVRHAERVDPDESSSLRDAVRVARNQLRDVTTRLRAESDRNTAMLDAVTTCVFAVDGGGRVMRANVEAARLFKRPATMLTGMILSDLLSTESLGLVDDETGTLRLCDGGKPHRFTTKLRIVGRRAIPADVAVTPLLLEGQRVFCVAVQDLTDQSVRDTQLRDALTSIDSAHRAKRQFLTQMSQELRSPLTSMIGFTRIISRSKSSQLSDRDRHYLARVQTSSEKVLAVINDSLDLAQLETGMMTVAMEEVNVAEIARALVHEFEPKVADRPVVMEVDAPEQLAMVRSDMARLRQILHRLLDNAVKFTARGTITLTVCVHHETGEVTALTVHDTGAGIPLDRQPHLFTSYEATDDTSPVAASGKGLGLVLCRRLAHRLGCTLSMESMPGRGSTFTLAFPPRDAHTRESSRTIAASIA